MKERSLDSVDRQRQEARKRLLAAKRAGVHTIVISEDNRKDIEDIKEIYIRGLEFHYVKTIQDVIEFIF